VVVQLLPKFTNGSGLAVDEGQGSGKSEVLKLLVAVPLLDILGLTDGR
jgi:hypothetical protein